MELHATFFPALWMRRPGSASELRVRFRGAGLPRSVRPYASDWRGGREQILIPVNPRRGGRALLWLEVGGTPTSNKLRVRVLPRKPGC